MRRVKKKGETGIRSLLGGDFTPAPHRSPRPFPQQCMTMKAVRICALTHSARPDPFWQAQQKDGQCKTQQQQSYPHAGILYKEDDRGTQGKNEQRHRRILAASGQGVFTLPLAESETK